MSSINKSFQFTILPSPDYTVGAQSSVLTDIVITELGSTPPPPPPPPADPQPITKPTVQVSLGNTYNRVDASGKTYQYQAINLYLDKPYLTPITVSFTLGGTAIEGQDYQQISRDVTFAVNQTSKTIILEPTTSYNPSTPPVQKQTVLISGNSTASSYAEAMSFTAYTLSRSSSSGSLSVSIAFDNKGYALPIGLNIPLSVTFNAGETTKYITGYAAKENYGNATFEFTVISDSLVTGSGKATLNVSIRDYDPAEYY